MNYSNSCFRFALDLIEVFFQIVHLRLPLLNPSQFRARFQASLRSGTPPPTTPTIDLKLRRSNSPQTSPQNGSNHNSPKSVHRDLECKPIDNAYVHLVPFWFQTLFNDAVHASHIRHVYVCFADLWQQSSHGVPSSQSIPCS